MEGSTEISLRNALLQFASAPLYEGALAMLDASQINGDELKAEALEKQIDTLIYRISLACAYGGVLFVSS